MKKLIIASCAAVVSLFAAMPALGAGKLPAFPGAEGFGCYTTGGRGGGVFLYKQQ